MKELSDGSKVSASSYYYLLDFNDRDGWNLLAKEFGKLRLHALNRKEYTRLYELVTQEEIKRLKDETV